MKKLLLAVALGALSLATGCVAPETRPPAPSHPMLVKAEQAMLAGDEDGALKLYRAYREGFAESAFDSECWYWEGTILLKKGRVEEAASAFASCIARPRSRFLEAEASVGLGDCRFVRDDYRG
ncbi:MAG TPA: tetratricopeptide repeat protein, partial [Planctomycetota bacterium]|nr:tetratricopeptide repeat protein [Planctomycetota bacterium]